MANEAGIGKGTIYLHWKTREALFWAALQREAMRMLESGVASAEDIDRAAVLAYRHPVGPLRLSDIVGLDVRLDIARVLEAAHGSRFSPPALLVEMVAEGKLGQKSGQGFFEWPT